MYTWDNASVFLSAARRPAVLVGENVAVDGIVVELELELDVELQLHRAVRAVRDVRVVVIEALAVVLTLSLAPVQPRESVLARVVALALVPILASVRASVRASVLAVVHAVVLAAVLVPVLARVLVLVLGHASVSVQLEVSAC